MVKSVKALLCLRCAQPSPTLESKLRQGLEYMGCSTSLLRHNTVAEALAVVRRARLADGHWAVSHVYRADGYVSFDGQGRQAPRLDHLLGQILEASQ